MKAIKISMLAMAFGLMSFSGKSTIAETVVKSVSTTTVSWKSEVVEVGEIPLNVPKVVEFEFINTGKSDVIITNVKASCGCTATDYTKTPIKAGASAYVRATYNAAVKGAFSKTVTVTTSDAAAPKVLTFKGKVI